MEDVGMSYGHLVYFTTIWYILPIDIWYVLWYFGIFSPVLVCCIKINLATLIQTLLVWTQDPPSIKKRGPALRTSRPAVLQPL
jgi:hypothetical protein